jgi:hypothetical protein
MTEEERQELVWARGMAAASLLCRQQVCRVIHEARLLSTEQLRNAIGEALAAAETMVEARPLDPAIRRVTAQTIRQIFTA